MSVDPGTVVSPPKITNFNPPRLGCEVTEDAVNLVGFLPSGEVVTMTIAREAWISIAAEVEQAISGIQVVRTPVVLPG